MKCRLLILLIFFPLLSLAIADHGMASPLILDSENYQDTFLPTLFDKLAYRAQAQPFNVIASLLFLCSILHICFANKFNDWAKWLARHPNKIPLKQEGNKIFVIELLRFCGEVEVIFGLWAIPLILLMTYYFDWNTALEYLNSRRYTEAQFVVAVMIIASTAPIVTFAEKGLEWFSQLIGGTVKSQWFTLLTLGPLLGSLITEPGAMTLTALLLSKHFFKHRPSSLLSYATIGLLFTNISVGGVLTSFAAPPVLIVSGPWEWDTLYMLRNFGINAIVGIMLANLSYSLFFRNEFRSLQEKSDLHTTITTISPSHIPFWVTLVNACFLIWIVVYGHYPVLFIGALLLFLGFYKATTIHQGHLEIERPLLIGFFLAGLVVHGGLQEWWVSPLLEKASEGTLVILAACLSAFIDNASITYLASLVPHINESLKQAVVAGAVAGGGLTVIANAPNPVGQSILSNHFSHGISPPKLFLGALLPTLILLTMFYFF